MFGFGSDAHPVCAASDFKQVANLLRARTNSTSYPLRDGKI